jgi:hypothetical protein
VNGNQINLKVIKPCVAASAPAPAGRIGAKTKKTLINTAHVEAFQAQLEGRRAGMEPLDFMLEVMRDPNESRTMRMLAAKAAAPYRHPALQATAVQHLDAEGNPIGPRIVEVERVIEHKPQAPVIIDSTIVGDTRH